MKSANYAIIGGTKYRNAPACWKHPRRDTGRSVPMCSQSISNSPDNRIPYGYCECGCGRKTPFYKKSDKSQGIVKGAPRRFYSRGCLNRWRGAQVAAVRSPFPHPALAGTACIPLNNGEIALIDERDVAKVSGKSWYVTRRGYVRSFSGGRSLLLHRLVIDVPSGMVADHINGNGLDNRRSNLRAATQAENTRNRIPSSNRPLPKGVRSSGDRFYAQITHDHKYIYLGMHDTPEEAARAYNEKAAELHGDFARPNPIGDIQNG